MSRTYYQIRRAFKNTNNPDNDYNYYVLDPNHHRYSYNFKDEKDVKRTIDFYILENPHHKYDIWYTKLVEEDRYVDDLKNGKMMI